MRERPYMKNALWGLIAGLALVIGGGMRATMSQEPLDGPKRIFRDELLDNLVGDWKLTRKIRGRTIENTVKVEWVLNHQFLRIHMRDVATPPSYEAMTVRRSTNFILNERDR